MKTLIQRSLQTLGLALAIILTTSAATADSHEEPATVLDILSKTDGAQAVVAAVLVVDSANVLNFKLADLLGDRHTELVLLAPSNAAFEKLLGLEPGALNKLPIGDVQAALPGLLPPGLDASDVANILLKHAALPKEANLETASEDNLLANGKVKVADESEFPVGIGASGVQVNYEATIIKPNIKARNGVVHFIDTVIVDDLLQ